MPVSWSKLFDCNQRHENELIKSVPTTRPTKQLNSTTALRKIISNMNFFGNVAEFLAYEPFHQILHVFDFNHHRNQERRILIRNIGQAFTFSIMILAFIVAILCDAWYCMNRDFNIAENALPVGILINIPPYGIKYISLLMKINLVDEVILKLKQVITKRKCSSFIRIVFSWHPHYIILRMFHRLWTLIKTHRTLWTFGGTIHRLYFDRHQIIDWSHCVILRCNIFHSCLVCHNWISSTRPLASNISVLVSVAIQKPTKSSN